MKYYICYDIAEDKIRRDIVKYLEAFAHRIQYSVFSCDLAEDDVPKVRKELLRISRHSANPMLLLVPVCKSCERKVWMKGQPLESGESFLII